MCRRFGGLLTNRMGGMIVVRNRLIALLSTIVLVLHLSVPVAYANDGGSNTEYEPENPGILDEQTAVGEKGMVVTAHPLASKIGAKVLKQGGNAVDAAVAVQFALNVVEPMMSGIGGGGFMMYYDADEEGVSIVNSRERAPSGASADMFLGEDREPLPFSERVQSGLSVGVPGTLKGLEKSLEKWGTMSLEDLILPSIQLAEEGTPVNWVLANAIKNNETKLMKSAAKDVFYPNGEALKEGDLLVQKDLAKTFKAIAAEGTDAFYKGEIGQEIAETVQAYNGSLTVEDLSNYEITEEEPVWGNYKGYDIATMPPPSSGGLTMLQLLKKFDQLDLTQYDVKSTEKYHLMAEAMRLAYADRGEYMGDPEHVEIPTEGLLNDEYVEQRVKLIDSEKANDDVKAGTPWDYQDGEKTVSAVAQPDDKENGETTHFTVVDQWGNVVSYTTTIEQLFGSGIMAPGTGILLNNELTDFDAVPGGANEVQPNKRPLSSMTPTIVFKGDKPYLTVGSPGGPTIITSVTQTIMNAIGYDMDLKDAIEEPRIYTNSYPTIRWEHGMPKNVQADLAVKGHELETKPQEIGNVNSILIGDDGLLAGAADSTREGSAIGVNLVYGEPVDFTDISNNWAKEYIEKGSALGIISGHHDNTFKPNQHLTRLQAASLIVRALGLTSNEKAPFDDIAGYGEKAQKEIGTAYHYGIVKGYGKEFKPNQKVTRSQMAQMLYRAYEQEHGEKYKPSEEAPFPETSFVSNEAIDAISMLYELEIVVGGTNGKFNPQHPTTRAHAAKMLVNFVESLHR